MPLFAAGTVRSDMTAHACIRYPGPDV